MELGSEICTPRSPSCEKCPVIDLCIAHHEKSVDKIPHPPRRTNYEEVTEVAVIIRHRGRILLRQCQPGERWAGLWDFPRFATAVDSVPTSLGPQITTRVRQLVGLDVVPLSRFMTIKHGVTRFRITLHCYEAKLLSRSKPLGNGQERVARWITPRLLADYPLSVTGRKISRVLTENKSRKRHSA